MSEKKIRCSILGAREEDLGVLSELHRQDHIDIAFVYDRDPAAVGLELSEIMGIPRFHDLHDISDFGKLDYVVVSEPRGRYSAELKVLLDSGGKLLTPTEAVGFLCRKPTAITPPSTPDTDGRTRIEDTFQALEKLLDRKELLRFLLDAAVRATQSTAGSIMLFSEEAKELYIAYAIGLSERVIKSTRQKLGEGIAGTVALKKQPQLLRLASKDSLYSKDRERLNIVSAISLPLIWEGKLLGVVNVSTDTEAKEHQPAELETLKKLAPRISRVLHESMRLQEVHVRHRELKFRATMGEIADTPVTSREKFSLLSRYLSEIMDADTVEIYMNTHEGDWFVLGGSNRWLTPTSERIRCQRGALARAFLEKRAIVLTESVDPGGDAMASVSSVVYCPIYLRDSIGVIVLEFSDRAKLDEFLIAKDAIVLELARFIITEIRERRLKRELDAVGRISNAAPSMLSCRSVEDLSDALTRIVAEIIECRRVSVRLIRSVDSDELVTRHFAVPDDRSDAWHAEDEKQFERLSKKKRSYSLAHLNFEADVADQPADYYSLIAYPIYGNKAFYGGVIGYEKDPSDPMEEVVFSDIDEKLLRNLFTLIEPVLESLLQKQPVTPSAAEESFDQVLAGNLQRLVSVCDSEITRADRYHHSFAIILFRLLPLHTVFEKDHSRALLLVDEITRGFDTRTRKSDYGAWIAKDTYAMVSLDSGRIRFLVARAMAYLMKDLSQFGEVSFQKEEILLGTASYPGTSKTAQELLEEAEKALKPHSQE